MAHITTPPVQFAIQCWLGFHRYFPTHPNDEIGTTYVCERCYATYKIEIPPPKRRLIVKGGTQNGVTYKIFAAFSDTCWRQRLASGEYIHFEDACNAADKAVETDDWLCVDFVVALDRTTETTELYRAKHK